MAFCLNCGNELPEGSRFCPRCGQAQDAPEVPVSAEPVSAEPEAEKGRPSPGKKLLPLLIGAAAVVVLGLVLIFTLGRGAKSSGEITRRSVRYTCTDADGDSWFVFTDGSAVKLKEGDGLRYAYLTPDEKYIVVLTVEGDLYVTDKSLSRKNRVEKDVAYLDYVGEKGFWYRTEDDEIYRYSFQDGGKLKVTGDADGFGMTCTSPDGFGLLYIKTEEGKLYMLPSAGKEPMKLGSAAVPLYLADDGKTAFWTERQAYNEHIFYVWEGKEKEKLGKLQCDWPQVCVSKDGKLAVLFGSGSDSLLIWQKGKEAVKVKIPGEWYTEIRTPAGPLEFVSSGAKELYIQSGGSLYRVDLKGEKEKLLSGVSSGGWAITGSQILWVKDGSLRLGKLDKDGVRDEEKLDQGLDEYWFSCDGKYVYYIKDTEKDDDVLYGYKLGAKEPVKIDRDVYNVWLSPAGDSLVYICDVSGSTGDLKTWTWGGESRKVSGDAVIWNVEGGYYYNFVDAKGFWFVSAGDLYFWNGKEKKKLVSEIDY